MKIRDLAKKYGCVKAALGLLEDAAKNGDRGEVRDYYGQLQGMLIMLEELKLISFTESEELSDELTDMI